jgi:hypothetical protein
LRNKPKRNPGAEYTLSEVKKFTKEMHSKADLRSQKK